MFYVLFLNFIPKMINLQKVLFLVFALALFKLTAFAQLNVSLIGDAVSDGDNCFTITLDIQNQAGGVWFDNPIDLDEDFSINFQGNFGSKDINGADGLAIVFKGNATPVIGGVGGGIGYAGISPSFIVEFDTFRNQNNGDPDLDHIGLLFNGDSDHTVAPSIFFPPVQASINNFNIEDGQTHEIKIDWVASEQRFEVFFDCILRISEVIDIKSGVFNGNDSIFFGFVGSTGGLSNIHQVCFNTISFVDDLQLEDQNVCLGKSITIDASVPSGETYSWSPDTGIDNPNAAVVNLSPNQDTTYTVTITDVCGESISEDINITVSNNVDSVFDPISPICNEDSNPLPSTSTNGISGTWSPAFDNMATTTYTFVPNEGECGFETTLEVVVLDSIVPEFNAVESVCTGEKLEPLPETSINGIIGTWQPELNNTETTTYTFTPNTGQGCTVSTTLTIEIIQGAVPQFEDINPVCEMSETFNLPTSSLEGIKGTWSPEVNNNETTTYTFTPDENQCAVPTELTVGVNPFNILFLEADIISKPFTKTVSVALNVMNGNGNYEYNVNNGQWQSSNIFENLDINLMLEFRARQINQCSSIAIKNLTTLQYRDYFTPNADGFNDYWNIEGLQNQPNSNIYIFDRYGKLLEQISPLQLGWDGTYNGKLMPPQDYWFRVEFIDPRSGSPAVFSDHFTLKR